MCPNNYIYSATMIMHKLVLNFLMVLDWFTLQNEACFEKSKSRTYCRIRSQKMQRYITHSAAGLTYFSSVTYLTGSSDYFTFFPKIYFERKITVLLLGSVQKVEDKVKGRFHVHAIYMTGVMNDHQAINNENESRLIVAFGHSLRYFLVIIHPVQWSAYVWN